MIPTGIAVKYRLENTPTGVSIQGSKLTVAASTLGGKAFSVVAEHSETSEYKAGKATVRLTTKYPFVAKAVSDKSKLSVQIPSTDTDAVLKLKEAFSGVDAPYNVVFSLEKAATGVQVSGDKLVVKKSATASEAIVIATQSASNTHQAGTAKATITLSTVSSTTRTVKYHFKFVGEWTQKHHPKGVTFPSSAHFTTLIGAIHAKNTAVFSSGKMATIGIERMAEVGISSNLRAELESGLVKEGKAKVLQASIGSGGGITTSTFEAEVEGAFPLVTLVSMIAPTADWFIGFKGDFKNSDGTWKDTFTIDAVAYDAGTENEDTPLSGSNSETDPQENISRLNITTPFVIEKGVVKPRLARL